MMESSKLDFLFRLFPGDLDDRPEWGVELSEADVWLEADVGMVALNLDLLDVGCESSIIFSIWFLLFSALLDLCSFMKLLRAFGESDPKNWDLLFESSEPNKLKTHYIFDTQEDNGL